MADQTTTFEKERLAIQKALTANWAEAIDLNLQILESEPENTAALNRLGIAYLKSNQAGKSKEAFDKVLTLDPFNTIAKSNLKKTSPRFSQAVSSHSLLSNHTFSFIEEPGKSKVVPLTNIGEPPIIASLYTGQIVDLEVSAHKVKVTCDGGKYVGSLPDDIGNHLIRLIRAGYEYKTLIKTADPKEVQIFIREIKASKKLKGIPSFNSSHILDDLDISSGNSNQPPLEIYDTATEEEV